MDADTRRVLGAAKDSAGKRFARSSAGPAASGVCTEAVAMGMNTAFDLEVQQALPECKGRVRSVSRGRQILPGGDRPMCVNGPTGSSMIARGGTWSNGCAGCCCATARSVSQTPDQAARAAESESGSDDRLRAQIGAQGTLAADDRVAMASRLADLAGAGPCARHRIAPALCKQAGRVLARHSLPCTLAYAHRPTRRHQQLYQGHKAHGLRLSRQRLPLSQDQGCLSR